jgi:[FeFe] hydrogenase H-cluster radical SAM maturase HydG
VLVLCGESPAYTFDDFIQALQLLRDLKTPPHGEFRRINVEIPPLSVSDMRRLKAQRCVGTFTLFQETYHPEAYRRYHPGGPKADYEYRLQTMDRAQLGGLDDVGLGALLGLHDYRFEVLAMLQHAQHLDKHYGTGPHTISIPRIRPALGAATSTDVPFPVDDDSFRKLVAVIRCAVPYTGMILSTRESAPMRRQLLALGVSQLSAGSRTDVGSYQAEAKGPAKTEADYEGQFTLSDERPVEEIVGDLIKRGCVPSWCTACYRKGRTGEAFMRIAKRGEIGEYCGPNALFTLKEYLMDYAKPEVRAAGEKLIEKEVERILDPQRREATKNRLEAIEKKQVRDVYF